MSRGQAAPRSAPAQDVWTRPLSSSPSSPSSSSSSPMSQPPILSTTHPFSHITGNLSLADVNLTEVSNLNSTTSERRSTGTLGFNRSVSAGGASSTEDYTRQQKAEFYQSYNPEIGLHTAAVLGGILGWLIIYLLYKTKVKKWVLSFLRKRYKKRKQKRREQKKRKREAFTEVRDHDLNSDPATVGGVGAAAATAASSSNPTNANPDSEGSGGSHPLGQGDLNPGLLREGSEGALPVDMCPSGPHHPPMPSIVVESCSSLPASRPHLASQGHVASQSCAAPAAGGGAKASPQHRSPKKGGKGGKGERKKKCRREKGRGQGRRCPEVTVLDVDDPDTTTLLLPPCCQADSAQATARWVQTMPLLMQSHQDVTGLLLKIRPSLLGSKKQQSCPLISAALQYAALPLLGLPHLGLNNSMPHLADNGMGSLKNSRDLLFDEDDKEQNKDVKLLQPLPYSAPASRPQSSQSHRGALTSSSSPSHQPPPPPPPRTPPAIPTRTPPIPNRSPPRLTIPIPDVTQQAMTSSSSTLAVPGAGSWGVVAPPCSAPSSPVPLPVTPTVTIQNCTPRVSARGRRGAKGAGVGVGDSEDSGSSSSSLDPFLPLQNDCHCLARPPPSSPSPSPFLPPSPSARSPLTPHPPSPLARPPPSPLPSHPSSPSAHAKTAPRASWTVFDDDHHHHTGVSVVAGGGGGGGGGDGGDGGGTGGRESGACSRQSSLRFTFPAPPSGPGCENGGNQGRSPLPPQDASFTLETKL